jgi:sec-independent protein translocase protein TatA
MHYGRCPVPHIGMPELLVILAVVLLLVGGSRLPRIGRAIGEAISNFRTGLADRDGAGE